jgi:hypothetical protein
MRERMTRRQLDIAATPDQVEGHDIVVLHWVVCCYLDHERLLTAAADHAKRLLVFSHPNRLVRGLCQTQYDPKDQERKVHTLCRVDDDAEPGAAEAPARKCVQEDTANYRRQDAPGLVEMVAAM